MLGSPSELLKASAPWNNMAEGGDMPPVTLMSQSLRNSGFSELREETNLVVHNPEELLGSFLTSRYTEPANAGDSTAFSTSNDNLRRKKSRSGRSSRRSKVGTHSSRLSAKRTLAGSNKHGSKYGSVAFSNNTDPYVSPTVYPQLFPEQGGPREDEANLFKNEGVTFGAGTETIVNSRYAGIVALDNIENGHTTCVMHPEGAAQVEVEASAKVQSTSFLHASNITTAPGQNGALEQRVLRPRRRLQLDKNAVIRHRHLQDVKLSQADSDRILGRRIKIYWPLDQKWYYGRVRQYDASKKRHKIVYDDHEEEWLVLKSEKFKLEVFPGEYFGHGSSSELTLPSEIEDSGLVGECGNLIEAKILEENPRKFQMLERETTGSSLEIVVPKSQADSFKFQSSSDNYSNCMDNLRFFSNASITVTKSTSHGKSLAGDVKRSYVQAGQTGVQKSYASEGLDDVANNTIGDRITGVSKGSGVSPSTGASGLTTEHKSACVYVRRTNKQLHPSVQPQINGGCNLPLANKSLSIGKVDAANMSTANVPRSMSNHAVVAANMVHEVQELASDCVRTDTTNTRQSLCVSFKDKGMSWERDQDACNVIDNSGTIFPVIYNEGPACEEGLEKPQLWQSVSSSEPVLEYGQQAPQKHGRLQGKQQSVKFVSSNLPLLDMQQPWDLHEQQSCSKERFSLKVSQSLECFCSDSSVLFDEELLPLEDAKDCSSEEEVEETVQRMYIPGCKMPEIFHREESGGIVRINKNKLQLSDDITSQALVALTASSRGLSAESDTELSELQDAELSSEPVILRTHFLLGGCFTLRAAKDEKATISGSSTPVSSPELKLRAFEVAHNLRVYSPVRDLNVAFCSSFKTPELVKQFFAIRSCYSFGHLSDEALTEDVMIIVWLVSIALRCLHFNGWISCQHVFMQKLRDALFEGDGLMKLGCFFHSFLMANYQDCRKFQLLLKTLVCSLPKVSLLGNIFSSGTTRTGSQRGHSFHDNNGSTVEGCISSSIVFGSSAKMLLSEVAPQSAICSSQGSSDGCAGGALWAQTADMQEYFSEQASNLVKEFCTGPVASESGAGLVFKGSQGGSMRAISGQPLKDGGSRLDGCYSSFVLDHLRVLVERSNEQTLGKLPGVPISFTQFPGLTLGCYSRRLLQRGFHLPWPDSHQNLQSPIERSPNAVGVVEFQKREATEQEQPLVPVRVRKGPRSGNSLKRAFVKYSGADVGEEDSQNEHDGAERTKSMDMSLPAVKKLRIKFISKDFLRSSSQSSECESYTATSTTSSQFSRCNQDTLHISDSSLRRNGMCAVGNFRGEKGCLDTGTCVRLFSFPCPGSTKAQSEYSFPQGQHLVSNLSRNFVSQPTVSPPKYEEVGVNFIFQSNGSQFLGTDVRKQWLDPKGTSFYNRSAEYRKRKRDSSSSASTQASELQVRRVVKRGRPSRQKKSVCVMEMAATCCTANILITNLDRGWRVCGTVVELQCTNGIEWMITASAPGGSLYTHKVLPNTPTGTTNCFTHAIMWKGGNGWSLEFLDRRQWNNFKNMYEECLNRNARAASLKHIPIPGVRKIHDSDVILENSKFLRPATKYIRQMEVEAEGASLFSGIVYDMDSDDELWLNQANAERVGADGSNMMQCISDEVLEKIMVKLEKASFAQQHDLCLADQAVDVCEGLGSTDVIKLIHAHWLDKRQKKGMPLVRQFQPALWKQYQAHVQDWQASLNELQLRLPTASKPQLIEECIRPPMFAFCLRPRGLDGNTNMMQKQRSHRKLSLGCTISRNRLSPTGDAFVDNYAIQSDVRVPIDKIFGSMDDCHMKLFDDASPNGFATSGVNSFGLSQTCSSGGIRLPLYEQPESSEHSLLGRSKADRQRPRTKKMHRKAKRMRTIVTAEGSQRKQRAMPRGQRICIESHSYQSAVDPDWQPSSKARSSLMSGSTPVRDVSMRRQTACQSKASGCSVRSFGSQLNGSVDFLTEAQQAQATVAIAKAVAVAKGENLRRLCLKSDSQLSKAVAAIIELEAIQAVEQTSGKQDTGSTSNEQLDVPKHKADKFSSQLSDGLGIVGEYTTGADDTGLLVNTWPAYCSDFKGTTVLQEATHTDLKPVVLSDAEVTLLPVASWSQELGAGLGTTLLQKG